jgi:hypothetical protein
MSCGVVWLEENMTLLTSRRELMVVLAAVGMIVIPCLAAAEPIQLSVNTTMSIQQIANSPCVIGDPSCHNPAAFPHTLLPPQQSAGTVNSPTYTVEQIRALVGGDTFFVGVDLNQAMGRAGGAYNLLSFSLAVNGTIMFSTTGPMTLSPINPGNGYSDAAIVGFDLAGLAPDARLVFTASFAGGTAGREQFFLQAGSPTGGGGGSDLVPTPEPTSILLVASGLVGALARRRRKPAA